MSDEADFVCEECEDRSKDWFRKRVALERGESIDAGTPHHEAVQPELEHKKTLLEIADALEKQFKEAQTGQ